MENFFISLNEADIRSQWGEMGKLVAPLATVASRGEWNPKLGKFGAGGGLGTQSLSQKWCIPNKFPGDTHAADLIYTWNATGLDRLPHVPYNASLQFLANLWTPQGGVVWVVGGELCWVVWTVLMLAAAWQLHFPSAATVSGMDLAGFKLGSSRRICEALIEAFSPEIWISSQLSSMAQLTKDSSPVITGVFKFSDVPAALPGNRLKKIQGWFILPWFSYFEKIISKSQLASSVPQIKYSSLFTVCCSVSSCFLLAILKLSNSLAFQDALSWPQSSNEFLWFPPSARLPGRPPTFGEPWAALFSRGSSKCPPVPQFFHLLIWMKALPES